MASRNIVMKKLNTRCSDRLCSSLWTSSFCQRKNFAVFLCIELWNGFIDRLCITQGQSGNNTQQFAKPYDRLPHCARSSTEMRNRRYIPRLLDKLYHLISCMMVSLQDTKGVCIWDAFAQSLDLILFHAAYEFWVTWSELQFVRAPNDLSSRIRPSECIDREGLGSAGQPNSFF